MSAGGLISVIIPTRNAGSNIESCLRSLQAQRFARFEVCVIDATSSDATLDKVNAHAGRVGTALNCLSEPDSGVYDAMNKGISRARNEWLYFLGADDVLHDTEVFADVARVISAGNADLVYGDVVEKNSRRRYGGEFTLDRLLFKENLCHQSVFYHRSLFERLGGYSMRYPVWADWDFNIRCFRHPGLRARWLDRLIAIYREQSGVSQVADPVFRKELPLILMRENAVLRERLGRTSRVIRLLARWFS
jgi:glycosyltransferase involved in cell wall biosynthesis